MPQSSFCFIKKGRICLLSIGANKTGENSGRLLHHEENEKIIHSWLRLHQWITVGFAITSCLVETIMCFILNSLKGFVEVPLSVYLMKYLVAPVVFNGLLLAVCFLLLHGKELSPPAKRYVLSLTMVGQCFIIFSIHSVFSSLALLFIVPILLTTIYGDYGLTWVTAITSILALTGSELFVFWDASKENPWQNVMVMMDFLISVVILLGLTIASLAIIYYERQKTPPLSARNWNGSVSNDRLTRTASPGCTTGAPCNRPWRR